MDPRSPAFGRILNNPFAYTAFKSTEPWLQVRARPCQHWGGDTVGVQRGGAGGWLGSRIPTSFCVHFQFILSAAHTLANTQEYISLDLHAAIKEAGFSSVMEMSCTPRHRSVVAVKQ